MKYTNYILKAYSLQKKAREVGVVWAITHDGALLTHKVMATHMGIKIVDLDAIHPTKKIPLHSLPEQNSADHAFLYIMVIGHESKQLIKNNFSDLFSFFGRASATELEGKKENPFHQYGYKAFKLTLKKTDFKL